jgi:hypothetical protein
LDALQTYTQQAEESCCRGSEDDAAVWLAAWRVVLFFPPDYTNTHARLLQHAACAQPATCISASASFLRMHPAPAGVCMCSRSSERVFRERIGKQFALVMAWAAYPSVDHINAMAVL